MSPLSPPHESVIDQQPPYSPAWHQMLERLLGAAACRQLGFYAIPSDLLLSVVIPIYNEEKTLREIVGRVRAVPIKKEIVLVDDASQDNSRQIMQELAADLANESDDLNSIVTAFHEKNRGKGAALRTGF